MNNPHVHPVIAAALQGFAPPTEVVDKAGMSRAELAEHYGWSISDEIEARREARESRYYAPGDPDAPEGD